MFFYFIAVQPLVEKAQGGRLYLVQKDAEEAVQFYRHFLGSHYKLYRVKATGLDTIGVAVTEEEA